MRKLFAAVAVTLLPVAAVAQHASTLTPAETALLTKVGQKLAACGHDPAIVAAVRAQNERKVTDAELKRIDKSWQAGGEQKLAEEEMSNACATRLRQLVKEGSYNESFVMDDHGANVCITNRTSYFWRGEMPKFQKAFAGAVFIDQPKWDPSAKARLVQVSVPVLDGTRPIGVLTVGLNADALMRR